MNKGNLYIWGWWQGNNLGDNWIKKVLSYHFPMAVFIDTRVKKFEKDSFVICGGGGLFIYDVISPWDNIQQNISYGMLGIGAEFPHETNLARECCDKAKFFYVRDQYSLDCMNLENIERSYDLTFSKPIYWAVKNDVNFKKAFFVWRDGHELLNNVKFSKYICNGSSYSEWKNVIDKKFDLIVEDDFQTRDDNIDERIADAGFVISGRYHGIVAAIQRGIPFIAIDICPKIRALINECDLEEYCIKISEINKLEGLIDKALVNVDYIREKEKIYLEKANCVLLKQIQQAKFEILKIIKPLNIIHYGSYWMKENDVVNAMSDDLGEICNLKKVDLKVYSSNVDERLDINIDTPNGKYCELKKSDILKDVDEFHADVIILNSGGLTLNDQTFNELKMKNVTTVGIPLSDPDVFPYNGEKYANKFDIFYTNSKYSLEKEYPRIGANAFIMPFAASIKHHYYMPDIERRYDVVVVAHARKDRILLVEKLRKVCSVGTYGSGWNDSLGVVNGKEHVKAINSGKMYLSFAHTVAGFDNVKVGLFEAMACNQVVITYYMEELKDYFDIGSEILCYRTEEELFELIEYYLNNEDELEKIRTNGYRRFLKEHTYEKRWNHMLKEIYKQKELL